KPDCLLFFFCQPSFSSNESDVGPLGVNSFKSNSRLKPAPLALSVTGNQSTVASTIPETKVVKRAGVAPICNIVTSLGSTPNFRPHDRVKNSESDRKRVMANFFPFDSLSDLKFGWP